MSDSSMLDFRGKALGLELLDAGSEPLFRLYSRPGADWEPPAPQYRTNRVDPPPGHEAEFAVLYLGNTLATVAMECRVLYADQDDRYTWNEVKARRYRVARYTYSSPSIFIPLDGRNRVALDLEGRTRRLKDYLPFREVGRELHRRYSGVVHGLSWESFHRSQPGRVYALWHQHKATIGLQVRPGDHPQLPEDADWLAFLAENPDVHGIDETS